MTLNYDGNLVLNTRFGTFGIVNVVGMIPEGIHVLNAPWGVVGALSDSKNSFPNAFYSAHLEPEDITLPRVGYLTCAPTRPTFRRWKWLRYLQDKLLSAFIMMWSSRKVSLLFNYLSLISYNCYNS